MCIIKSIQNNPIQKEYDSNVSNYKNKDLVTRISTRFEAFAKAIKGGFKSLGTTDPKAAQRRWEKAEAHLSIAMSTNQQTRNTSLASVNLNRKVSSAAQGLLGQGLNMAGNGLDRFVKWLNR